MEMLDHLQVVAVRAPGAGGARHQTEVEDLKKILSYRLTLLDLVVQVVHILLLQIVSHNLLCIQHPINTEELVPQGT